MRQRVYKMDAGVRPIIGDRDSGDRDIRCRGDPGELAHMVPVGSWRIWQGDERSVGHVLRTYGTPTPARAGTDAQTLG
jgi:hypothetical protein